VESISMSATDFVEVYRPANAFEAHLLKASLEAAGIAAQIENESIAGLYPNISWAAPRILVAPANAVNAAVIVRELSKSRAAQSRSGHAE
jgi:hypothetical protein